MNEIDEILRDVPGFVNRADNQSRVQRSRNTFARENVGDTVRVRKAESINVGRIKEFVKYPTYQESDGVPLLIKFTSAQLALIQLHGLDGHELRYAAQEYIDQHLNAPTDPNFSEVTDITRKYNNMLDFICDRLQGSFKKDILRERLNGYTRILGLPGGDDERLKNCPIHEIDEAASAKGQCTCAMIKLIRISSLHLNYGAIHRQPSFISQYEIANTFIMLLGTAVYYTAERKLCETNPRSFDVGNACRHMAGVLSYATALLEGRYKFTPRSEKYSDGKGSKLIIGFKCPDDEVSGLDVILPDLIYSISYNLFGRMWLAGVSGFNLKHNGTNEEFFGASWTHDGAPHLNPNRSIGLYMLAPNDLPFVVEMRIWGDGESTDEFNHQLTLALRRLIVKGLVKLLFGRNCESNELITTGDLRTKVVLPRDLKIDADVIEAQVKRISDSGNAREYVNLILDALRNTVTGKSRLLSKHLTNSHTELKIQTLLRVRGKISDDGYLLTRVIVFPWIRIIDLDTRIKELAALIGNIALSENDVIPTVQCPPLSNV